MYKKYTHLNVSKMEHFVCNQTVTVHTTENTIIASCNFLSETNALAVALALALSTQNSKLEMQDPSAKGSIL